VKVRNLVKLKIALIIAGICAVLWAQGQEARRINGIEGLDTVLFQAKLIIPSDQIDISDWSFTEIKPLSLWSPRQKSDSFLYDFSEKNNFIEFRIAELDRASFFDRLHFIESYNNVLNSKYWLSNYGNAQIDENKVFTSDEFFGWQWVVPEKFFKQYFLQNQSQSVLDSFRNAKNQIRVFFKGIEPEDLAVYHVLSSIIAQQNSTYTQNMVQSGLALSSTFSFHPARCADFLYFQIEPNPFGIKEAVEAFFAELYAMPLFDYTSKEQLNLAKERIIIDVEFSKDRFNTYANFLAGFYGNDLTPDVNAYLDSVAVVTKVDIMNFIRKYLHNQPYLLYVNVPNESFADVGKYIYTTREIDKYVVPFENEKSSNLSREAILVADSVAYILNLTTWANIDVVLNGKAKKREKEKRAKAIEAYFKSKNVGNNLRFIYKSKNGLENSESIGHI